MQWCYFLVTPFVTTLSLNWIQPGSPVDNYTVSYTYTIRQCGPEQTPISGEMNITGSTTSATLDDLEEDSDYSIIITANVGAIQVDFSVLTASTAMSGNLLSNSTQVVTFCETCLYCTCGHFFNSKALVVSCSQILYLHSTFINTTTVCKYIVQE